MVGLRVARASWRHHRDERVLLDQIENRQLTAEQMIGIVTKERILVRKKGVNSLEESGARRGDESCRDE
jgi:hypothetical protein